MRKLWVTLLLLSVSLFVLIAPIYVEGDSGVADHTTKTKTNTHTATTTMQSNPSATTEPTSGFILKVEPPRHTIHHLKNDKTKAATYLVWIMALPGFRGEVELSIDMEGLPADAEAIFNPEEGVPKPVFISILKILVQPSTPAGAYTLNVIASSDSLTRYATTTLVVEGEAAPPTTRKPTGLRVSVSTDQESYLKGDEVAVSGFVRLTSGASVPDATVSIGVLDPAGQEVHVAAVRTNQAGRYSENFALPSGSLDGTYTVYVTASMTGHRDRYATVTFTVGISNLPSVRIVNATITGLDGAASSEFHPGETVVIWAAANNTGADLKNGNMWVEVLDPDISPITLVVVVVTVRAGEQARIGVHVILGSNAKLGTYTVRILVSNAPITAGGRFLDIKEINFIVSSETSQTTTTTTLATTETQSTSTTENTLTSTTQVTSTTSSETSSSSTTETTESASTSATETT